MSLLEGIYQDIHDHHAANDKIIAIAMSRNTMVSVNSQSRYELLPVTYAAQSPAYQFLGYPIVFINEMPDDEWLVVVEEHRYPSHQFTPYESQMSYWDIKASFDALVSQGKTPVIKAKTR